ncbi:MAG TPA: hypothetical protein VGF79_10685 [Bacteroidia bacterium]
MSDLETIERYFTGQMPDEEAGSFLLRRAIDPGFDELAEDYLNTVEALKRVWIKDTIKSIKRGNLIRKVILGLTLLTIVLIALFVVLSAKATKLAENRSNGAKTESYASNSLTVFDTTKTNDENITDNDTSIKQQPYLAQSIMPSISKMQAGPIQADPVGIDTAVHIPEVKWQFFTIDNTIANQIKLEGGTLIDFEPFTLMTVGGKTNLKEVNLKIKEFSGYYELFQENLHTMSNLEQLKTGGSCYIEAESQGDQVKVMPEASYTIRFPGKPDSDMATFYGNRNESGTFNWEQEKVEPNFKKADTNLKFDVRSRKRPFERDYKSDLKSVKGEMRVNDTIYYFEAAIMDEGKMAGGEYTYSTLNEQSCFKGVFDDMTLVTGIDIQRLYFKKSQLLFRFNLDSNGRMSRYDYNFILGRKERKILKRSAKKVMATKTVNLSKFKFNERIVNVTLLPRMRVVELETNPNDSSLNAANKNKDKYKYYNAIVASQFGYINCDAFATYKNKRNMNIGLRNDDKINRVQVFFRDINSVMTAFVSNNKAKVVNVPDNMEVMVIVLAGETGNERMYIETTKTGSDLKLSNGQPLDLVVIKERLLGWRRE